MRKSLCINSIRPPPDRLSSYDILVNAETTFFLLPIFPLSKSCWSVVALSCFIRRSATVGIATKFSFKPLHVRNPCCDCLRVCVKQPYRLVQNLHKFRDALQRNSTIKVSRVARFAIIEEMFSHRRQGQSLSVLLPCITAITQSIPAAVEGSSSVVFLNL